jgi:hypothetical protein
MTNARSSRRRVRTRRSRACAPRSTSQRSRLSISLGDGRCSWLLKEPRWSLLERPRQCDDRCDELSLAALEAGCGNLARLGLRYADAEWRPMSNSALFHAHARAECCARAKAGAGSASWRPQIAASERNIHNLSDTYGLTRFLWLFPFVIRGRDRLPAQAGLATFMGCFRGGTRAIGNPSPTTPKLIFGWLSTFVMVNLGWTFFCMDLPTARFFLERMFLG